MNYQELKEYTTVTQCLKKVQQLFPELNKLHPNYLDVDEIMQRPAATVSKQLMDAYLCANPEQCNPASTTGIWVQHTTATNPVIEYRLTSKGTWSSTVFFTVPLSPITVEIKGRLIFQKPIPAQHLNLKFQTNRDHLYARVIQVDDDGNFSVFFPVPWEEHSVLKMKLTVEGLPEDLTRFNNVCVETTVYRVASALLKKNEPWIIKSHNHFYLVWNNIHKEIPAQVLNAPDNVEFVKLID